MKNKYVKSGAILISFLIVISFCFAKEIEIPQTYNIPSKEISEKEIYFYAGSNLIASNKDILEYEYQKYLGSNFKSKSLPFGEEIINEERFSFTGKENDGDLYYFNARYYNPGLGRFTTTDPIEENNPYSYARNNPLKYVDPNGKETVVYGINRAEIEINDQTEGFFQDVRDSYQGPINDVRAKVEHISKYVWSNENCPYDYNRAGGGDWYGPYEYGVGEFVASSVAYPQFTALNALFLGNQQQRELSYMLKCGETVCHEKAIAMVEYLRRDKSIAENYEVKYGLVKITTEFYGGENFDKFRSKDTVYHAVAVIVPKALEEVEEQYRGVMMSQILVGDWSTAKNLWDWEGMYRKGYDEKDNEIVRYKKYREIIDFKDAI